MSGSDTLAPPLPLLLAEAVLDIDPPAPELLDGDPPPVPVAPLPPDPPVPCVVVPTAPPQPT
ncbi:MAG: hypothetical protein QM820_52100 [Minicystis sp.]